MESSPSAPMRALSPSLYRRLPAAGLISRFTTLRRAAMDLYKLIQDLNAEKEKLERVIASLEELQRAAGLRVPPAPAIGKRRGRNALSAEEKQEVSARMKR